MMQTTIEIPWWMKIIAKVILSLMPVNYRFWKGISLFKHGAMDDASYALKVFQKHYKIAKLAPGFVCMELGPGDSLGSALLTKAFGGSKTYLIDAGNFASRDFYSYQQLINYLVATGLDTRLQKMGNQTLESLLLECSAQYLTDGLASLKSIPSGSVDFVWSNAVLEHIRLNEYAEFLKEVCRVTKDTGVSCHTIDLRDHLQNGLNNLRFSEKVWESNLMAKSGFYTNRLRYHDHLRLFEEAGFVVEVVEKQYWSKVPTNPKKFHPKFKDLSVDDLNIAVFVVKLRPRR